MKKRYAILVVLVTLVVALAIWLHFNALNKPLSPTTAPIATKSYITRTLDNMSLRDKVASLFILHTPGTDANKLTKYLDKFKPAGLILMLDNIPPTTSDLSAMTSQVQTNDKLPLLIATDEEGGVVTRLASDTYTSAMELRGLPPEATKQSFANRSSLLKSVGINLNFGIVADVTNDPNSFIYKRVLGKNGPDASIRVAAAVKGTASKTLSTLKHFPGHGETNANSHLSIPVANTSYNDWLNRVSAPFQSGIKAGANLVMFGQLAYPLIDNPPATLSSKWHQILRDKLGFQGVTITDDMVMLQNSGNTRYTDPIQNTIDAINAGNTLILFVTDHVDKQSMIDPDDLINGVTQAALDGRIDQALINKNARKVLELRSSLSG